ncbi:exodeoxyribonuclease VII large subunit [Fervidobacterium sp.]
MEKSDFRLSDEPSFSSLKEFVEYVNNKLKETNLLSQRVKFVADVVKVKPYNGTLYITVSQESEDGKKIELTVILWKTLVSSVLKYIGVKNFYDLEHKKWEFQGRLSFYNDRFQFSFWADSIAPQGESDILKRRQKIKEALQQQGLITTVLHELSELEPIRLVAVVTSKTAQGYFDFLSNLLVPENYRPVVHLYESSMQGASTAQEVIAALDRIEEFWITTQLKYDVVAIIRGGGGPSDLMFFDDYNLAVRIAKMNEHIPVLTGIGHEKDETVADYVAWRRFPTPTAVAKEISNQIKKYLDDMERHYREIKQMMMNTIDLTETKIQSGAFNVIKDSFNNSQVRALRDIREDAKFFVNSINVSELERKASIEFVGKISKNLDLKFTEIKEAADNVKGMVGKYLNSAIDNRYRELNIFENISASIDKRYVSLFNMTENVKSGWEAIGGPLNALSLGGALLTKDGELINSIKKLKRGDTIRISLIDGKSSAKII